MNFEKNILHPENQLRERRISQFFFHRSIEFFVALNVFFPQNFKWCRSLGIIKKRILLQNCR